MSIPIQINCDTDNPDEHAIWALVGLPGAGETAPLAVPEEILAKWSRHLWQCGFRWHEELQEIKFIPPDTGTGYMQAPLGKWVDISEPDTGYTPDLSELTTEQKQHLLEYLQKELNSD